MDSDVNRWGMGRDGPLPLSEYSTAVISDRAEEGGLPNGTLQRVCSDCGRRIPRRRLAILPQAVRCVECQRGYESGRRGAA